LAASATTRWSSHRSRSATRCAPRWIDLLLDGLINASR